jgi:uncharacterized protein
MTSEEQQFFLDTLRELRNGEHSRLISTKQHTQHGKTSVYKHCASVAYVSYRLAKQLHLKVDERALLRGALLHDYFLYDWHAPIPQRKWHGFRHPALSLCNAEQDFELDERERDIIKHHMFPLTMHPPRCKEGVIVCLVDKWVSTKETLNRR